MYTYVLRLRFALFCLEFWRHTGQKYFPFGIVASFNPTQNIWYQSLHWSQNIHLTGWTSRESLIF